MLSFFAVGKFTLTQVGLTRGGSTWKKIFFFEKKKNWSLVLWLVLIASSLGPSPGRVCLGGGVLTDSTQSVVGWVARREEEVCPKKTPPSLPLSPLPPSPSPRLIIGGSLPLFPCRTCVGVLGRI